jgi:hypothetical protein
MFALVIGCSLPAAAGDDWQPITPEDLKLKDNPAQPGAHAMILYRENNVDNQSSTVSHYIRLKIFTEEGKKWGDVQIPFVKGYDDIHNVRARTIRPDGSVVNFDGKVFEKEVYKNGGFKFLAKTFSMPEVQPGCILEYKYVEQHDSDYYVSPEWVLQEELFTRYAKFSFKLDPNASFTRLAWRNYLIPPNLQPKEQSNGTVTMEAHDVPGLEEEEYILPRRVLESRVSFFYRSLDDPAKETPDQYWKRMGKKWNDSVEHFMNRKGALESEVNQIVTPSDSAEAKLRKIYARVQKIRNTAYDIEKTEKEQKRENLKENENVEDVLKRGYGSSRQINRVLAGLARAAGFDAGIVFVADRNENFFNPQMEDPSELDAEVVWVHTGDKDIYLDPSARYYPYGMLPWPETGVHGLRLNKQGGDFIVTPDPKISDARLERHAELTLDADGNLSGKVTIDYFGQSACVRRTEEREDDDAGKKKDMTSLIQGWLLPGASFEVSKMAGWDDNDAPVHIEGTLRMANFGTATGRRILVPVTIFRPHQAKSFESAKRINVVYFHYPYTEHDALTLHAPDGYGLETAPPAQKTPEELAMDYSLTTSAQGSQLEVERRLNVKQIFFEVKTYVAVRSFFNEVKNNDEAQFVLRSAQTAEKK